MEQKGLKIITTADGSSTLELADGQETYHSRHGAVQESTHVFIDHGLRLLGDVSTVRIFEMGFGTGLNAFLSAQFALTNDVSIHYRSIEAFPIGEEHWSALDFNLAEQTDLFRKLHLAEWETEQQIETGFILLKEKAKLLEWQPESGYEVDLVYYDAFGPRTQSELWDTPALRKMHGILKTGGQFVTYCAQGQFKRNLKTLGFEVKAYPGPPGKREMTVGIKL